MGQITFGLVEQVLEHVSADVLVFLLTDPSLNHMFPNLENYKHIFEKHYKDFTKDRILQIEKNREREDYIYDEDMQCLPKQYYDAYKDSPDDLSFKSQIAQAAINQIQEFREIFDVMVKDFDFHQCFHYAVYKDIGSSQGQFKLHQRYVQAED